MQATVIEGKLISVDTNVGQIQIKGDEETHALAIDEGTNLYNQTWKTLIGCKVEAIVIDGKTNEVYEPEDQE